MIEGLTFKPDQPEFNGDGVIVSAVDWLGNRFRIGDQVLYCITQGSGGLMAYGTVVEIADAGHARFDMLTVKVRTLGTASEWKHRAGERRHATWVNAYNVTAVPGMRWPE